MFPAKSYRYTLKRGMNGHDVWALQINLNEFSSVSLVEDGSFGPATESALKSVQYKLGITIDGIAGPRTQQKVASNLLLPSQSAYKVASGIMRGLIEGESGWCVGAVNWNTPGGVDCGWVQRRVYDWNYNNAAFYKAFHGPVQFQLLAESLRKKKDAFYGYPGAKTNQRAWELAVLDHNWPWGADQLAQGKKLSTSYAAWVDSASGGVVTTPAEWAEFYIDTKTMYVTTWTA